MRLLTGLILTASFAGTAMADTGHGSSIASLAHQLFGLHHLPFNALLIVATVYLIRRWQRSKRTD